MLRPEATIERISKVIGIAGQLSYTARVSYSGEEPMMVEFVGSAYGSPGPITMITRATQAHVYDPGRFGEKLNEEWVRRFFGEAQ